MEDIKTKKLMPPKRILTYLQYYKENIMASLKATKMESWKMAYAEQLVILDNVEKYIKGE